VGGLEVRRALPQRARRTIGAWCFIDHFGPTAPEDDYRMMVGPHPHIGLSTVTWLLDGEGLHTDSLGSEQPIRPGELNLMTAGSGIAHAEETPLGREGRMHGVQFWVAQPEATRHDPPAFEHHGELPIVSSGPFTASVLVGSFEGERSPARADTEMLGLDVSIAPGEVEVPLRSGFEHGIVALDGSVLVDGELVEADTLVHLGTGRSSLRLGAKDVTRLLLIGGTPFESPVLMWWNFVARTTDEIDLATTEWNQGSDRFGVVDSGLGRIPAPDTPWGSG
jgi:quercetin 2,3-dioxygenase